MAESYAFRYCNVLQSGRLVAHRGQMFTNHDLVQSYREELR